MKSTNPTRRRAVAYARYSSELQSARSVEDQIVLCRGYAERNGLDLIRSYDDRAKSGSSMIERDGLMRLLADAKTGAFEIVVVEALDRISRDQEDMAAVYKRLKFSGVDIVAVHDGKADVVQIGIRGLIGAVYLEDLKHKTRRGMAGRVRDGLSAGGRAYGYRPVLGKPGELVIEPEEAEVVRRIFRDFAAGKTPREIAWALNREGIAPPRGTVWNASTINGSAQRKNGMIRAPIYAGKIVWNRVRMIRDPETGKRISRLNPESEWQVAEVEDLRIVDAETIEAVAARLEGRKRAVEEYTPRRPRMLSGLLRCGCCGGGMTMDGKTKVGQPRIRCSRAREAGTCDHSKKYALPVIERAVVDGLREQLANPKAVALYVETYIAERRRLALEASSNRGRIERELEKRRGELERMIDLVIRGVLTAEKLVERKAPLDAEIERLEADLVVAPPIKAVDLHPGAMAAYARDVATLSLRLEEAQADPSTTLLDPLRRLVAAVIVHPSGAFAPIEIEIKGKLAALLGEEAELPPAGRKVAIGLVAGEGLEPPTPGL